MSQHFTTTATVLILVVASTQPQTPAVVAERVRTAILAKESGWRLHDSALEDRRFWHERVLANGEMHPNEIKELAKGELITEAALKRAKKTLGIESVMTTTFPASVIGWRLPAPM